MRLLIATTNPAKLAEYALLLKDSGVEPVSLTSLGITAVSAEDGASFADNALKKARFYFDLARIPTLADDGGLEIDALGGEPGVRSHRWLGSAPASDQALAAEVIRRMAGVPAAGRTARLRAAAALVWNDAGGVRERIVEAALEGYIAEKVFGTIQPGFPYRAVFILPGDGRYLAELSEHEAAALSQRHAAVNQLRDTLKQVARSC
jgi:XTP/dITP diphosphohydrolase